MKCPFCNNDMIYGSIRTGRNITWQNAEDKTNKIIDFLFMTGEVVIDAGLNGKKVEALRCYECKKLIIDLKDEE